MQSNMMRLQRVTALMTGVLATGVLLALIAVAPAHAEFGIAAFDQQITADATEAAFTQANGHPYLIRTEIDMNSHLKPENEHPSPDADPKDVLVNLPPGEFGNPVGLPQCTLPELTGAGVESLNNLGINCPVGAQLGLLEVRSERGPITTALYNMAPPTHLPALFGANIGGVPVLLSGNVRNGSDYGVTIVSANLPFTLKLDGFTVTFWGTPADPSHDFQRCAAPYGPGTSCPGQPGEPLIAPQSDPEPPVPFLTISGSCPAAGVGSKTNLQIDSWRQPGVYAERDLFSHVAPGYLLAESEWGAQRGTTGCEREPFQPSISVQPTNTQADTPSGLNVEISVPQEGLLNSNGIGSADVKKAVVTLPAGESVSPSAADGLGACTLEEIGLATRVPANCPDSSKLGSVEIDTPLLSDPMKGSIYLGKPECEPCSVVDDLAGRLLKLYLVVESHGVILKLPGHVELDPVTGRIVTTFDNNPQLPFSHLKLNFKAGPRSPLVNPSFCGEYSTQAEFTPWSGTAPVHTASAFQITSGPGGKPCPAAPQAFGPSFAAGTTDNQAGAFSPLSVSFSRSDGEQQLGGVTVKTPPACWEPSRRSRCAGNPRHPPGPAPPPRRSGPST